MAVIPPAPPGTPIGSFQWADWYDKLRRAINEAANIKWSQINDFTGSNLTQFVTRNHNDLQNIQGGTFHLSARGNATLVSGTVAVAAATITAAAVVQLTYKTISGTPGILSYVITAGVGITINSNSAVDSSTVSYFITEA